MNFSALSIRHPVPAILLFILLTIFGLIGFKNLTVQQMPDIEFPVVMVNAALEGASPSQLETEVARKLEDEIATIAGVRHLNTTIREGSVSIAVEFELEKDSEEAQNQVRNGIDRIKAELPAAMHSPSVSKLTTAGGAILTYTVSADRMSESDLSWFVDNTVAKSLRGVPGVGVFTRVGGVDREILIELDTVRMASLGIDGALVSAQLGAVQKDFSGGQGRMGDQTQAIRTLGATASRSELAALQISVGEGRQIRLDQIARLHDTDAERASIALLDQLPVVAFQITRSKGAGEIDVARAVRTEIDALKKEHPMVRFEEAYNTIEPIESSFKGSMQLLYEGALLAVLVVFWFLRDWRATLISAAALPLSIIPTFGAMYLMGFSLNMLTLLSLALVIGILVDDAIVEVENIVRHLRMGKSPIEAATDAAQEIGLAVVATTMTLVAVFLPTALMGGIPGRFFKQFGITAAVAVLASLLVARLLTPMMAAHFLKNTGHTEKDGWVMRKYLALARACQTHRKTTTFAAIGFFVASLALMPLLPTGFVPPADRSQTQISIEQAPGTRLEGTLETTRKAVELIRADENVKSVFSIVGGASDQTSSLVVDLIHRTQRDIKQSKVENALRERLAALPGVRVKIGGGGGGGANGDTLQLRLSGENEEALNAAARALEQDLRTLKGIGAVTSSASLQRPEIQIRPDFARAAEQGVTSAALAQALRLATYGDYSSALGKLNLPERQVDIRVRHQEAVRGDLNAIRQIRVQAKSGLIPLGQIAEISMGSGPSEIVRYDRQRQATLSVELAGRSLGEVMSEAQQLPALQSLPAGVKQVAAGEAERMAELFGSFGLAMLAGILCIYVVLVLLFHDFLQPATILAALPLSVGGAFSALLITGNSFSLPSIIGLLMLMGIVTKNSILLVEYAVMARREHGMSRFDALMDACHKRARPIVMTTIAMGAGMLPIAMGWGADDPSFRSPMAVAVIGGLITSTLLSLLVIPVVFTYVDDFLVTFSPH